MKRYLSRTRQAGWMDGFGLRVAILLACQLWFSSLWGVGLPALLAGAALAVLVGLALRLLNKRTVARREKALRERIGGELALESMLLAPPRKAHFQAAMLVGMKWPIMLERVAEEGVLCRYGTETLLIACMPLPQGVSIGPERLMALQRACKRLHADRGVACMTSDCSAAGRSYAEQGIFPLRLMEREEFLTLAGKAWPAGDEQLVALGKRRKKGPPLTALLECALRREKARRYVLYGTGLTMTGLLLHSGWYLLPGIVCLLLGILCRYLPRKTETL